MVTRRRNPALRAVERALWARADRREARRRDRVARMARAEAELLPAADAFAQAARRAREALETGRTALPRGPLATVPPVFAKAARRLLGRHPARHRVDGNTIRHALGWPESDPRGGMEVNAALETAYADLRAVCLRYVWEVALCRTPPADPTSPGRLATVCGWEIPLAEPIGRVGEAVWWRTVLCQIERTTFTDAIGTDRAVGAEVHEVVDGYLVRLPDGACGAAPTREAALACARAGARTTAEVLLRP